MRHRGLAQGYSHPADIISDTPCKLGSMKRRKLPWILALASAAVCAACTRAPRATAEAGPFSILRKQHSYSNWNTGGTTTYFTYEVRYRRGAFSFEGFRHPGNTDTFQSSEIERAYVISKSPAALMVLAGDPNNDASWNLLVDTPSGLRAEHVAHYGLGDGLAWLDGDVPETIADARDLLQLDGGRWLWVEQQALLDRDALRVQRLATPDDSRAGAQFVMFSPDRRRMARFTTRTDRSDYRVWYPVMLVNDMASGGYTQFDIDAKAMWFDDNRDIDPAWITTYFEWRNVDGKGYALHARATPAARPYHGRLEAPPGSQAVGYRVPRLRFEQRKAAMELIATTLGGTYSLPDEQVGVPAMPTPATATATPTTTTTVSEPDANDAVDAAVSAPSVEGPLARADLVVGNQTLAVYFSDRGLSIENGEPALNDLVRRIAATVDSRLAQPEGQVLIAPVAP